MIFHQNAFKTGFSAIKGQKGQIVENPITKSFFGTKPFQLIKAELIFIPNRICEKKIGPKFKGQGHLTPCNYEGWPSRPNFFSRFLINMTQRFLK